MGTCKIVPEIVDLKFLYIEADSSVYYDINAATSGADVESSILSKNLLKVFMVIIEVNESHVIFENGSCPTTFLCPIYSLTLSNSYLTL